MERLKSYLIGLAALAMALSTANAEELWEHYFKGIMNSGYMVTGTPAGMIAFKGRITLDEKTALDAYAIDLEINGERQGIVRG